MDENPDRREFVGSALSLGVALPGGSSLHRRFGLGPRVVESVTELYFGSGDGEAGTCNELVRTSDGGYAFTGGVADSALWLVKVGADGSKEWDRRFWTDATQGVSGQAIVETSDGGFFLAGEARSVDENGGEVVGPTTFAVKTAADGGKQWRTRLEASAVPDNAVERVGAAVELGSGGYVIAGGRTADESAEPVFTKLTADGNIAWKQVRNTRDYVSNSQLEPGSRSGIALLESTAKGFRAALLAGPRSDVASLQFVRFDADGTERTYEEFDPVPGGMSLPIALARHPDGGYVMLVKLTTAMYGPHGLISLTESFDIRWRRRLTEVEGPRDIGVGDDGGVFVVGKTNDGTWVSRYTATGSHRWVRTGYRGTSTDEFAGLSVRDDAVVVGGTAETGTRFRNPTAWVLELVETDDERLKGVLGLAGVGLVWTLVAHAFGGGDDGD